MNVLASMRYLAALNEHRHFGRAAQACHITQPALSNALRALEGEFGVLIVKRGRAFEGFTVEGEAVLATAQRMLQEQELLRERLRSEAGQPRGRLRLAAVPTGMKAGVRTTPRGVTIAPLRAAPSRAFTVRVKSLVMSGYRPKLALPSPLEGEG